MRIVLAALAALLLLAAPAAAHPLGNFSISQLDQVSVSRDAVTIRHIVDQAEIPTFQERGSSNAEIIDRKRGDALEGLELRVDGEEVELRPTGTPRISFPPGQGGLKTTRVELDFTAAVEDARRVELSDETYGDRVGWKSIIIRPGEGTAVRSSVPTVDVTGALRRYPRNQLSAPLDVRSATFDVSPGSGTVTAPGPDAVKGGGGGISVDGFGSIIDDAAAGDGLLILFLLAAFGWGALHALSPGHGKAMVAAYLVGTRGRPRDALLLGATVTVTHTAGVFALGLVTLALAEIIVPEDLFPWLQLVSGALVLAVGAAVLRARIRGPGDAHAHDHHHEHCHHGQGNHDRRNVLALGASAGIIPCPSALVVLLGAIAQEEVLLGMLLIVTFSVGLAATLSLIGLAVVLARRRLEAVRLRGRWATVAHAVPVVGALAIVGLGLALTARAVPGVL